MRLCWVNEEIHFLSALAIMRHGRIQIHVTTRHARIHIDHVEPVQPLEGGLADWNTIVERMFVAGSDKLRVVCEDCHKVKTKAENALRRENRKEYDHKIAS